jgi:predicted GH43/DUF377 family glycosyl hydrolase
MRRGRAALVLISLASLSCNRYADFTLPAVVATGSSWLQFSENRGPVLLREKASDVLNPSVVESNGELLNFYSEYDGRTWHTALARSTDGNAWRKEGRILSPDSTTWEDSYIAANGSAAILNGRWFYWYVSGPQTKPRIGLATSSDPANLLKSGQPVLSPGPRGSFDELAVADPYVIRISSYWYMFYLGEDRARRQQIGLARSEDGIEWFKLRSNPVLGVEKPGGMDDRGLGEPAVWQSQGWYWMLFTGRDAHENRSLGLARSSDGVNWVRSPETFRGSETWDSKVLCDPTVLVDQGRIRVWFGGGDVASPDQNLHGQIGTGEMK